MVPKHKQLPKGANDSGVPISVHLDSASPIEMKLLEPTIENIAVPKSGRDRPIKKTKSIVADKGYNSVPLCERLAEHGIELICPYQSNNKKKKHQDDHKMQK